MHDQTIKKFALLAAAVVLTLALAACDLQKADIVMITGVGTVEDRSFNQGTWEGVRLYAGMNGKTCYYYQPAGESDEAYMESIRRAAMGEAEVILLPGHYFADVIGEAQEKYPDISFVLLDTLPTGGAAANTVAVTFAEEQAGYMAGYAAVKEGYRSLGFLGGDSVPGVVGFGLGYAQGANAAALELGEVVELRYAYTGTFEPGPEIKERALDWYADGTEVIFACGGAMGASVFEAAEEAGGKTIGVDADQSGESETVIVSATKAMGVGAGRTLEQFYTGAFPGGEVIVLGAAESAVGLSMESSRMKNFTGEMYEALYNQLVTGAVTVQRTGPDGAEIFSPGGLGIDLAGLTLTFEE